MSKLSHVLKKLLIDANHSRGNGFSHRLPNGLSIHIQIRWGENFVRLVLMRAGAPPSLNEMKTIAKYWPYDHDNYTIPKPAPTKKHDLFATRSFVHMDLTQIPAKSEVRHGT